MMAARRAPICDFVKRYEKSGTLRLHMPGHKGRTLIGPEGMDLTEIRGADSLFEADGIIAESEANASALFGARTFYSVEGSSLCIRTMLALIARNVPQRGEKTRVLAARNVHKSFLSAVALLDVEVDWLYPTVEESYLSCTVTAEGLERALAACTEKPAAVYITSPDYLGNVADVKALAAVCHAHGVYLLVDNAHGAYLKFLAGSAHPIDLGADLCCDSAHKTLPVLTGGAYLHVSHTVEALFADKVKATMALFASTSPSYLILQSLDAVNPYLVEHGGDFAVFAARVAICRSRLEKYGFVFVGNEPLKWTIATKSYGYTGMEFADVLRKHGIECEFADPDHVVMMLSPAISSHLNHCCRILAGVPRRAPLVQAPPRLQTATRALSPREALLSPAEVLPVAQCLGRILADATVGCPPAVPILVCGERINEAAIQAFLYYGTERCSVVK